MSWASGKSMKDLTWVEGGVDFCSENVIKILDGDDDAIDITVDLSGIAPAPPAYEGEYTVKGEVPDPKSELDFSTSCAVCGCGFSDIYSKEPHGAEYICWPCDFWAMKEVFERSIQ